MYIITVLLLKLHQDLKLNLYIITIFLLKSHQDLKLNLYIITIFLLKSHQDLKLNLCIITVLFKITLDPFCRLFIKIYYYNIFIKITSRS